MEKCLRASLTTKPARPFQEKDNSFLARDGTPTVSCLFEKVRRTLFIGVRLIFKSKKVLLDWLLFSSFFFLGKIIY